MCIVWGENANLNFHFWFSFFFFWFLLCGVWVIFGLLATLVYLYLNYASKISPGVIFSGSFLWTLQAGNVSFISADLISWTFPLVTFSWPNVVKLYKSPLWPWFLPHLCNCKGHLAVYLAHFVCYISEHSLKKQNQYIQTWRDRGLF